MAQTQRTELKPVPRESWEAQDLKNQGTKAKFQLPKEPQLLLLLSISSLFSLLYTPLRGGPSVWVLLKGPRQLLSKMLPARPSLA